MYDLQRSAWSEFCVRSHLRGDFGRVLDPDASERRAATLGAKDRELVDRTP